MPYRGSGALEVYYRWTFDGHPVGATSVGWHAAADQDVEFDEVHFTSAQAAREWFASCERSTPEFSRRFRLVKVTRRQNTRI